jgi:glycosyltransferase involved in cell wall biosynthesis
MAMRILAISDLYPPDIRGGAEISTSEAVDGLRERGHEVVVATGASGPALTHVRRCLEYRPPPRWHGGRAWLAPWRAAMDYRRAFYNPHNEAALTDLMAQLAPEVVYVGGIGGVGPCSILRALRDQPAPVVAHLRDYWLLTLLYGGSEFSGMRLPWLKRLLIGLDARRDLRLTSMIALSQTLRDRYLRAGFAADAIEVIPQGMRLSPVERRQEPPIHGELRLLFVGRLDPEKGAHLLLQRLAVVAVEEGRPRIRCDLAGPPGPEAYMRRLRRLMAAGALQGSVCLLGSIQRETILRLYARYDAVVVPSLWQEPFSRVVPEALAAGTAVVASRRVGAVEWFEDGRDLLLFSPQAPEELDQALRRLRDEPGLAGRLAEAGSRKARQVFDKESFLDRLERHLMGALERPKLSPLLTGARGASRMVSPSAEGSRRAA